MIDSTIVCGVSYSENRHKLFTKLRDTGECQYETHRTDCISNVENEKMTVLITHNLLNL